MQAGAATARAFVWLGLSRASPTTPGGLEGQLDILPTLDLGVITADGTGLGGMSFPAPAHPGLAGGRFALQGVALDRNGAPQLTFTNRATIRL